MEKRKLKDIVKLLEEAHEFCEDNDKSTEFTLEYMQDFADVDLDTVLDFIKMKSM